LQAILDQLDRVVDCDACALMLQSDHRLRMAASHGFHLAEAPETPPSTWNSTLNCAT
jgi:hypothetical protein